MAAKPIKFRESNTVWKGWPAKGDREEVSDLPAFRQDGLTISCWRLDWLDRLCVLITGRVWVHVHGRQPPIYTDGRSPFRG